MWFLFACVGVIGDSGKPADAEDSASGTSGNGFFDLMSWDETGICIQFTPELADSTFGIAQTGLGDAGWYDEDCRSPNPGDEPDGGYDICHPVLGRTELYCLRTVATQDEVIAGSTTIFGHDDASDLTYVLLETDSGDCATWGQNRDYYLDLGCVPI